MYKRSLSKDNFLKNEEEILKKNIAHFLHRYFGDKMTKGEAFTELDVQIYLYLTNILCGMHIDHILSINHPVGRKIKEICEQNKYGKELLRYL